MLIETNIEVNLRSIEEFTRVMVSELLEDKINFEILKEGNFIKIKVKSEKLNKNTEFSYIDLGNKIEDPIEYIFENKKSLIIQRELGKDVESFEKALKSSLRQDPDVIILGEIRDEESLFSALKLAETGHLVFSTLHTMNTVESVNRLISMVRTEKKDFIREQLASVLRFILSQELHRGKKTVPIFEILNNTKAVANLILNNKLNQIPTLIESGIENFMITKEKYLKNLETESD